MSQRQYDFKLPEEVKSPVSESTALEFDRFERALLRIAGYIGAFIVAVCVFGMIISKPILLIIAGLGVVTYVAYKSMVKEVEEK